MKAIPFQKKGPADALEIVTWPDPMIEADEVLIEVKAFGLNYADIMARKGQYYDAPPMPFIPGYEVAGVVKEVGSSVKKIKKGQKVLAFTDFGGYAELAKTKEEGCLLLPKGMNFAQAASIPVNFATAYHCLHNTGIINKTSRVLIHAAAGGVGLSAIQIAKNAGCEVFGTAGSDAKLSLLKEYGVDHPINYRTQDFAQEVMRITDNEGIDIILDSIGGAYIKKGIKILRPNGRMVSFGVAALSSRGGLGSLTLIPEVLSMVTLSAIDLLSKSKSFYGVNMKALGDARPDILRSILDEVLKQFEKKKLKTVIHKEYSWKQIAEAHALIESRASTGKIVLLVD